MSVACLRVATFNILNFADRWDERLPLLLAEAAALSPDLFALQEVVYPMQQDRLIAAAGPAHYRVLRGHAQRPEFGNSLLVREPLAADLLGRVELGLGRAAHGARVALPEGASLFVAVTHLHHPSGAEAERDAQVSTLVGWLDGAPATDGQLVMGDFNADPLEPACARMRAAGFRSAFAEANGADPPVTWPSGLVAPAMDTEGIPECLDYIWVRGAIAVRSCRLVFDRPAAGDPTLYPSDHFGLLAELEVG